MKQVGILLIMGVFLLYAEPCYFYKYNKKTILLPLHSSARTEKNIDFYQNERGIVLGVSDGIIVKLKDSEGVEDLLKEFNLTLKKKLDDNLYLLKTQSKKVTIELSNRLHEKEGVEYAHPDFIKKSVRR